MKRLTTRMYQKAVLVFSLCTFTSLANATTYTVGSGGTYASLYAAFDDINNGVITGSITLQILNSLVESFPCVLDYSGFGGSYTDVTIYPTAPGITISGSFTGQPLIDLNGADYVTIDGRVNGTGSTIDLTLHNTTTTFTPGQRTRTLHFKNNAQYNQVKYCNITLSEVNGSPIHFESAVSGQSGNSHNVIEHCKVFGAGSTLVKYGISSDLSTAGNNVLDTIRNCELYNIYEAAVFLRNGSDGWNISNNSFYQPSPFTNVTFHYSILIEASNSNTLHRIIIDNNHIGGSQPLCGGSPFTFAGANANKSYNAMKTVSGGYGISITNNKIKNILIDNTTKTGNLFFGIENANGRCLISGNEIGDSTTNGSITINTIGSAGNITRGIYNYGNDSVEIAHNVIGSIRTTSTNLYDSHIAAIEKDGNGYFDIHHNHIGSNNTSSSIEAQSATGFAQNVIGIFNKDGWFGYVRDNNVANLYNGVRKTVTTAGGSVIGVYLAGSTGNQVAMDNTIGYLYSGSAATDEGMSPVIGIFSGGSPSIYRVIESNYIHNLIDSNSSNPAVFVNGISTSLSAAQVHHIRANFITDLYTVSTAGTVQGIQLGNLYTPKVNNNIIHIGNTAGKAYGIKHGGNYFAEYIHNTIVISSSTTSDNPSACLMVTHPSVSMVVNNIFENNKANASGITKNHHCVVNTTSTAFPNIDYNNYRVTNQSTGAAIGQLNGVNYNNFNQWKVGTAKDSNSTNIDPLFANVGGYTAPDYYPNATLVGKPTTILIDHIDNPRSATSPKVGALELSSPLPIHGLSFTATDQGNFIALEWTIVSDEVINSFLIERSTDGLKWEMINEMASDQDNENAYYRYEDIMLGEMSVYYYRIAYIDASGIKKYTPIKKVVRNFNDKSAIKVYPNPTTGILNIDYNNQISNGYTLLNSMGKVVSASDIKNNRTIDFSNYTEGVYYLLLHTDGQPTTIKITKH